MARFPWRRGQPDRAPELTGVWARSAATSGSVQRRTAALGTPPGEVGALLSRAAVAGATARSVVDALCAEGSARWPDVELRVPSDARARALHDRVGALVAAQRAALHRATLLTMPADSTEQAVLVAGLRRAVTDLETAGTREIDAGATGGSPPAR